MPPNGEAKVAQKVVACEAFERGTWDRAVSRSFQVLVIDPDRLIDTFRAAIASK